MARAKANGKAPAIPWRDRIVGLTREAPDQLLAHPLNAKIHPAKQQAALEGSINDLGWIDAVKVNDRSGRMIDGHARITLALRRGEPTVPVLHLDLDESEEAEALATFDAVGALAVWDKEKLDDLLHDIQSGEAGVQAMLADLAKENGLYQTKVGEDAGPELDRAGLLAEEYGTAVGQVWQLGEHRLVCGDATDPAVIAEALAGAVASAVFTDPPYGIEYDPGWLDGVGTYRRALSSRDTLANDDGNLDLSFLWQYPHRMVWGFPYIYDRAATGWIVWDKQPGVESRGIVTPIEMASTTMRKGFDMVRVMWGGYYRAAGEDKQPHPTQKPLGVYRPFIKEWTRPGDVILDPFCGSAPVVVLAQELGRVCRAVELEPKYVAVSIQRWADLTGLEPVCVSGR